MYDPPMLLRGGILYTFLSTMQQNAKNWRIFEGFFEHTSSISPICTKKQSANGWPSARGSPTLTRTLLLPILSSKFYCLWQGSDVSTDRIIVLGDKGKHLLLLLRLDNQLLAAVQSHSNEEREHSCRARTYLTVGFLFHYPALPLVLISKIKRPSTSAESLRLLRLRSCYSFT